MLSQNDTKEVLKLIAKHRERKERLVFTNGCFDLIHVGHVRYLEQAKQLGNILVVGLNGDDSVKRIKGAGRPVTPVEERREILLSLRAVDYVCVFDEDTPLELIKAVSPDVLVKGGDWPVEKIVGADFVQARGGEVRSLPYLPGHSTSEILERVKRLG